MRVSSCIARKDPRYGYLANGWTNSCHYIMRRLGTVRPIAQPDPQRSLRPASPFVVSDRKTSSPPMRIRTPKRQAESLVPMRGASLHALGSMSLTATLATGFGRCHVSIVRYRFLRRTRASAVRTCPSMPVGATWRVPSAFPFPYAAGHGRPAAPARALAQKRPRAASLVYGPGPTFSQDRIRNLATEAILPGTRAPIHPAKEPLDNGMSQSRSTQPDKTSCM